MRDLPEGWVQLSFGDLGEWRGGGTPSKSNSSYWRNGTIPWVSPKDMKRDRIDGAEDMITREAIENSSASLIPSGSLLIVTRSGILKHSLPVAGNTTPVAINQDIKALTPLRGLNVDFFRYQISLAAPEILSETVKSGTTVESVDFKSLKNFKVLVPPTSEQERIVQRLDGLLLRTAAVRSLLKNIPTLLDSYRASLLARAFDGNLTKQWRVDRDIPTNWLATTLGEIAEIQSGITLGKIRSPGTKLVTVPYLRVANVQRGWLDLREVKRLRVSKAEADRLYLRPGDILMNEGGDRDKLGRGWVWGGQIARCIHQNHVFRVRLRDTQFPSKYVSLFANEFGKEHFFSQGKQTTNLASISKSRLSSLPVMLPSTEEAFEILRRIDSSCGWIDAVRHHCDNMALRLRELDQSILVKAFRGELVPHHPNDEPIIETLSRARLEKSLLPQVRTLKRKSMSTGRTVMNKVDLRLADWPKNGLTFEQLRNLVGGDYEGLKEAVFQLLAGPTPTLEQRFDRSDKVMRLMRADQ